MKGMEATVLEATLLRLIAGDGRAPACERVGRAAEGTDRAEEGADRRVFMAGRAGPDGGWTWVAPESRAARSFLPGPFSLALMIGGGGSRS